MSGRKRLPTRREFQDLQRLVYLIATAQRELARRIGDFLPVRYADALVRSWPLKSRLDDLACRAEPNRSAVRVFYGSGDGAAGELARNAITLVLEHEGETLPHDFMQSK